MSSVQTDSAQEALVKLATLPLPARETVSHQVPPNPSGPL